MTYDLLLTTHILVIIPIACLAVLIAETSGIVQWIKWKLHIERRIKPFDCSKCLAWWIGVVYFLPLHEFEMVNSKYQITGLVIVWLSFAAAASIASVIITKQLHK